MVLAQCVESLRVKERVFPRRSSGDQLRMGHSHERQAKSGRDHLLIRISRELKGILFCIKIWSTEARS
eukprot:6181280-Pleurochrysis_carterae.AAC.2